MVDQAAAEPNEGSPVETAGPQEDQMVDAAALAAARDGHPLPSPVPDDADLWEGVEQPFTLFGQFGVDRLDQRVFSQDVWWVDRLGRPYRLEDMSEQYRRNVLGFLSESVTQRWLDEGRQEALTAFTDAVNGKVAFALLAHAVGVSRVSDVDPVAWLESTPLVRRLRQLTSDLADPDPPAATSGDDRP